MTNFGVEAEVAAQAVGVQLTPAMKQFIAANPGATAKNAADAFKAMTVAEQTATVASKALGVALNMLITAGVTFAITELIQLISDLSKVSENAVNRAQSVSDAIKQNSKDIANYKQLVEEAQAVLRDDAASAEERQSAREQLKNVQSEMIEQYGKESDAISSINSIMTESTNVIHSQTEAIETQITAWKNLETSSFNAAKTQADAQDNLRQKFVNFIKSGGKTSSTDIAIDDYKNGKTNIPLWLGNFGSKRNRLYQIIKELSKEYEVEYDIVNASTSSIQGSAKERIKLLETAIERISSIKDLTQTEQNQLNTVRETLYNLKQNTEAVSPLANQQIYEDIINVPDSIFKANNDVIQSLIQEREKALSENNQSLADQLTQDIVDALDKAKENAIGESQSDIRDWYDSTYSEYVDILNQRKFDKTLQDAISNNSNTSLTPNLTYDRLNDINQTSENVRALQYSQSELQAFNAFKQAARDAGVSIDYAIQKSREFGNVTSEALIEASNYFNNLGTDILRQYSDSDLEALMVDIKIDKNASKADLDKALAELQQKSSDNPIELYSSFDGSDLGERLSDFASKLSDESITITEYFEGIREEMNDLQDQMNNFDGTGFANSIESATSAAANFFTEATRNMSNSLTDTIINFDNGTLGVLDYLDNYTGIANSLSDFADTLQESYSAWTGEDMTSDMSQHIDEMQQELLTATSTINQYTDSIAAAQLLMSNTIEVGTEEYKAYINVVAEDLANIVTNGGAMADTIASELGSSQSEIANNLMNNVSNFDTGIQAILANTNSAIDQMANNVASIFDALANAIDNFKVELNIDQIGTQSIGKILGQSLGELPQKITIAGSSSGFSAALRNVGKTIANTIKSAQEIKLADIKPKVDTKDVDKANKKLKTLNDNLKNAAKGGGGGGGGGAKKAAEETKDALQELSSALDEVQSAYQTLMDIQESYNENGYITVDQMQQLMQMDLRYLAMLNTEGDAVSVNEQAFQSLTQAKLEEMQVALARQTLDLINSFTSEAVAVEYLAGAYGNLAANALTAAEAALYAAAATQQAKGGAIAQATGLAMQGYENAKNMMGHVNYGAGAGKNSTKSPTGKTKEEEEAEKKKKQQEALKAEMEAKLQLKTVDWTERLFEKLEKTIDKWTRSIERMFSYWSKNWATDKAIKNIEEERSQQWVAYRLYMKQAKKAAEKAGMSVEVTEAGDPYFAGGYSLDKKYQKLIANGAMKIEDDVDPVLYEKIQAYTEWFNKAQNAIEKAEELYDKELELLDQKYQNIVDYYDNLANYYDSITSMIDSRISLTNAKGQKTSFQDYIDQFQSAIKSAENYQESLFRLSWGATEKVKTVPEAEEDIRRSTNASIGEAKWYQEIINHVDYLNDKLQTYQEATQLIKDLKIERKYAGSKEEKKEINQEIKEAKNIRKTNKLSGWEKKQLQASTQIIDLINNNTEAFKSVQKINTKIDKLLSKTNGVFSKKQEKTYDKLTNQLNSVEDAVGRVSQITGNVDVLNSGTYQKLLGQITKTLSKNSLNNKALQNIDKWTGAAEWIAKNSTSQNADLASTIYQQLYKLEAKREKNGKLGKNDAFTEARLKELQNTIATEKVNSDKALQRQLIIAKAFETKELGDINNAIEARKESINALYDQMKIDRMSNIKESKAWQDMEAGYLKYVELQNKADTSGKSKDIKAAERAKYYVTSSKGIATTYEEAVKMLEEYGTSTMTKDEFNTLLKMYKQSKTAKAGSTKATAALSYLEKARQARITEDRKWEEERISKIEEMVTNYNQLYAENQEKANEALEKAWEISRSIVEYNVNDLLSQIDFIDAVIDKWQQLANLYDQFDPSVLKDKFKLDVDTTKSATELLREGYETAIGNYDAGSGLMGKIKKQRDLMAAYQELIDISQKAVTADGKTDWSKIFANYKQSDVYKNSEDIQNTIKTLEELLASNDYSDNTWVADWNQALAEAEKEVLSTIENVKELTDALRENVTFKAVYDAIEALDLLENRFSSLSNIILDDWVRDANGVTDFGYAKAQLLYKELQASQQKTAKYAEHIKEIMDNRDLYTVEKEYTEALNQAQQDYADSIANTESIMSNIYELSKNLEEAEIERFENLIEAQKKALQKKKEYWDYSKNVRNAQNEIEAIEAQINALNGVKICPYLFNCWNALKLYDYNITMKYA